MSPDAAALVALTLYLVAGAAIVWRQIRRSGVGTGAWVLYFVARLYGNIWLHWRADSRCPFPPSGPAIIIANHRSPTDPMVVWMNHHFQPGGCGPIRVIGFLMAREYYNLRGLRWLCRTMQSIPADRNGRDMGSVKEALARLKAGQLVGIFPEGRINDGPNLLPAGSGMAWLALRANVPVYPVYIHGAPQGESMVAHFVHRSRVRVTYGAAVDLSRFRDRRRSEETLREATDLLMGKLAELGGLSYRPGEPPRDGMLPMTRDLSPRQAGGEGG